jgi:hypothetical protein
VALLLLGAFLAQPSIPNVLPFDSSARISNAMFHAYDSVVGITAAMAIERLFAIIDIVDYVDSRLFPDRPSNYAGVVALVWPLCSFLHFSLFLLIFSISFCNCYAALQLTTPVR